MIMLLSFFACLTSMFALVSDSVEMIRFVTFATCHNKWLTILKSISSLSLTNTFHASTLPPVALLKIGKFASRGNNEMSLA